MHISYHTGKWTIIALVPGLFLVVLLVSTRAAELRPFPMQNHSYRYRPAAPTQRVIPQTPEITDFKRDIAHFSCGELNSLRTKLRTSYNQASTYNDKRYFSSFLDALELELKQDNCR